MTIRDPETSTRRVALRVWTMRRAFCTIHPQSNALWSLTMIVQFSSRRVVDQFCMVLQTHFLQHTGAKRK